MALRVADHFQVEARVVVAISQVVVHLLMYAAGWYAASRIALLTRHVRKALKVTGSSLMASNDYFLRVNSTCTHTMETLPTHKKCTTGLSDFKTSLR